MHDPSPNYRSLELICSQQAALTSNEVTRRALLALAAEYRKLAERQEGLPE
jgi:hypothetical protein